MKSTFLGIARGVFFGALVVASASAQLSSYVVSVEGQVRQDGGHGFDRYVVRFRPVGAVMDGEPVQVNRDGSFRTRMEMSGPMEIRLCNSDGDVEWSNIVSPSGAVIAVDIDLPRVSGDAKPIEAVVSVQSLSRHVPKKALKEREAAMEAIRKRDVDKSIAHLRKAVTIAPDFAEGFNDLGERYLERSEIGPATECFRRAVSLDPGAAVPEANLAMALYASHEYGESERAARAALRLNPALDKAQYMLGLSLAARGVLTAETTTMLENVKTRYKGAAEVLGRIYRFRRQNDRGAVAQD